VTQIAVNQNVMINNYHLSEASIRRGLLRQYVNNIATLSCDIIFLFAFGVLTKHSQ